MLRQLPVRETEANLKPVRAEFSSGLALARSAGVLEWRRTEASTNRARLQEAAGCGTA